MSNYIVAPFGSNTNIASGTGTVSYEVHNMTTSPGLLSKVNKYIQQSEQVRFAGTWMLVVEWNDVPQSGQTNGMVCVKPKWRFSNYLFPRISLNVLLKLSNILKVHTELYQSLDQHVSRHSGNKWVPVFHCLHLPLWEHAVVR